MPTIEAYRHELADGRAPGPLLEPLIRRAASERAAAGRAGDEGDDPRRWLTERLAARGELERMLDQAASEERLRELLTDSLDRWVRSIPVTRLAERLDAMLRAGAVAELVPTTDERELWALRDGDARHPSPRTLRALLRSLDDDVEPVGPDDLDDAALSAFVQRLLEVADGALETGRIHDALRHHFHFAPRVEGAVAAGYDGSIAPRRRPERPSRGRRGDLWLTARRGQGDAATVLLVDDGEDNGLEVSYAALVIDDDLDAATWLHPILIAAETTLGLAQRLRLDRELHLTMEDLDVRLGYLTAAGARTLTRVELGLLPDERFGTPPPAESIAVDDDPTEPDALGPLGTVDEEPDDEEEPHHAPVTVLGAIDGAWPRRAVIAPGVIAVVDLLAGDAPPAAIVNGHDPQMVALAEHLRIDPAAAKAVRRLVIAETRIGARPHGLWVLDSALAAAALVGTLPEGLAAAAAPLAQLLRRRARQAVQRLWWLPAAAYREGGAKLRGPLLVEVAKLQESLAETPELELYRAWRRKLTEMTVDDLHRRERRRSKDRAPEFVMSADPWDRSVPVSLAVLRLALTEGEAMLLMRPRDGRVQMRLALRFRVLEALEAERAGEEDAAVLPGGALPDVWVQLFDPATGEVVSSRLLEIDAADSALVTSLARPPQPLGVAVHLTPTRWIAVEPLLVDGLLALPAERTWVARYLRSLAEDLTEPEMHRALLLAAEATAAAAVDALAGSVLAGASQRRLEEFPGSSAPRLPTGLDTIVTQLLLYSRAARESIADGLLESEHAERAMDLEALHALDEVLR